MSSDDIQKDERRFREMEVPDDSHWVCKIPESVLGKLDVETREYIVNMDRVAQKQDWIMNNFVILNNRCFDMESDVIRSRKFRTGFLIRFATLNVIFGILITIFGSEIRDRIFPKQNDPNRTKQGP